MGIKIMKKLNLAVIGCGDVAGYVAWLSRLVPQVQFSACCDLNVERLRSFSKRHRIPQAYTDYADMLANAEFDSVYLSVPHNLHYEMIISAIEAGKPVFVEKPITRTLEEGLSLIEAITNLKVGVNYQNRYDKGCYALARAVQAGKLGNIHSVRINIPWHREEKYFEASPWHKTITQAGGGTLITQGSHFLDIALWALGERPVSASGYTKNIGFDVEVDTLAHGIVETESGALISITTSMVAASEQAVTIDVYGDKGTAKYQNLPFSKVKFKGVNARKENPPEWGIHVLQRSLAGFANWILFDKPYLIPAHESIAVLAAVDGIYRSAASGKQEIIEI